MRSMKNQKGVSLLGLIFVGGLLIMVALLAMKVFPVVVDYYTILENVKATGADPGLKGASVQQVRDAYNKRMQVSGGSDILPEDLDITKENGDIVISFEYAKKVHLFKNVNLLIEFKGGSSNTGAAASSE